MYQGDYDEVELYVAKQVKLGRTPESVVHDLTALHMPPETAQAIVDKIYKSQQSAQMWNDLRIVLIGGLLLLIGSGLAWWIVANANQPGMAAGGQKTIGMVLLLVGLGLGFVGGVWFLFSAFQESIGWGFACLVLPLASLLFLFLHPERAIKPFLVSLVGSGLMFAGLYLQGLWKI